MNGIERIGEKIFDFIKNWGSIFIDIDDVKLQNFTLNQCGYSTIEKNLVHY